MHVPDGMIDAPVSIAAGAVAAGGVLLCARKARAELDERTAPLAGLVAAFVFAAQMLNFPIAGGTSGHLLGGVLAAALVGPWTGALCVAVVIAVQALMLGDGGLTALGVNILDMSLVTVLVGAGVLLVLTGLLPRTRAALLASVAVASLLSVVASAAAFTGIYAVGGSTSVPLGTVLVAMVGTHVLIGLGEAVITTVVMGAVLATRPDLVHAARRVAIHPPLQTAAATAPTVASAP